MKIDSTYGTMYFVTDMAKTTAFYKENFGLKPRFESPEWTEFDVNGAGLCLHSVEKGQKVSGQGTLIWNVTDIKNVVTGLKKMGVEFMGDIKTVHPGAFSVEFKDPSGNVVSLYEDTNRRG